LVGDEDCGAMDQPQRRSGSTEIVISAVTGTYNRLALLQKMVTSVRQSVGGLLYEIILVDGGSTDGTLEWCRQQSDVMLIEQGKLLGAVEAFNAGCEVARGRYVAILNDDIVIDGDTLGRAYEHLEANPEVGMVAFRNVVPDKSGDRARIPVSTALGYPYGQCCMVRRWLGQWAEWWGHEGMRTYGGDTRLSLRLWEMGWPVVYLNGCSVTDFVHVDELRRINSDAPWEHARKEGKPHPDLQIFNWRWLNRLPTPENHIRAVADRVLMKAAAGNLRFLRFKGMMRKNDNMRMALAQEMARFGESRQVNQAQEQTIHPNDYQDRILQIVAEFAPDVIMFQAQRPGNLEVATIERMKERWPHMLIANFDGDTHYPLLPWHFAIAGAVHLQLVVSPTLFPQYATQGIGVAYWPIGVEREYLNAKRKNPPTGHDVIFTGSYYGETVFPEGRRRGDAVVALARSGLKFGLFGPGWERLGLPRAVYTMEKHADNAALHANAKMAMSISQASDLWGYTSDRLYNICATGCSALVQRFLGMEEHGFTDGDTCIAWGGIPEMLEKARYYLKPKNEACREAIGRAGRKLILERHTWAHRVESLFAIIEGLKGDK